MFSCVWCFAGCDGSCSYEVAVPNTHTAAVASDRSKSAPNIPASLAVEKNMKHGATDVTEMHSRSNNSDFPSLM